MGSFNNPSNLCDQKHGKSYFSAKTLKILLTNLFNTDGNFIADSNSDGIGNGWTGTNISNTSISSNEQIFTATAANATLAKIQAIVTGKQYYFFGWIKSNKTTVQLRNVTNVTTAQTVNHVGDGEYHFYSILATATVTGNTTVQVRDTGASGWTETRCKKMFAICLTDAFGTNIPLKTVLDDFMKNQAYFVTKSYP